MCIRDREVTINLPLYGGINSFVLGMPENALLGLPLPRADVYKRQVN